MSAEEYEFEEIPGLPGSLPRGEKLLWQGSPQWWALARRALYVIPVSSYFLLIATWQGVSIWQAGMGWQPLLHGIGRLLLLGALAIAMLCLLAWASARATVYSLTNRRLVIRHGVALPIGLNLPLPQIEAVAMSRHRDGTAELALALPNAKRVGYVVNWPHVRAWHFARPQPTLRAIADGECVAKLLTQALASAGGAPALVPEGEPAPRAAVKPPRVPATTQAA
jgi:Bacterial PH domain